MEFLKIRIVFWNHVLNRFYAREMKLVLYRSCYVLLELHWYSLVPKIVRLCTDLGLNFSGCEKGNDATCVAFCQKLARIRE